MAKKNKLAIRAMKEILAGIDEANEILRPLGAQALYPASIEYFEDFGSYIRRYTVDVNEFLEHERIVITSTRKEVKAEG